MQLLRKDAGGARRADCRTLESPRTHRDQVQQHEELADRLGHQSGDVPLAWLLAQPAVNAPSTGPRTQEQLDAGLRVLDVELDEPTFVPLLEVLPGCRALLEDYVW
jgi:aryl-alcohol dehydrogenase-like predicted oxidoreductase